MRTVAWITWLEILRKRVFIVTIVMTAIFLGLYTYGVHGMEHASQAANTGGSYSLVDTYLHSALWLAMGLYVSNFTVAYLSIFSAAGTISSEIENGILLAILPRPIPRWKLYVGKWLGYTSWSLLYGAVMFWSVVIIVHLNVSWAIQGDLAWPAFGVFETVPVVLVTLSVLGSLYFPTLGNGVGITLLFGLGLIGGFIQRVAPVSSQIAMNKIGLVTSLVIPTNAAYYRAIYELLGGSSIPVGGIDMSAQLGPFATGATPSNGFLCYIAIYIVSLVLFGAWRFTRKDIS